MPPRYAHASFNLRAPRLTQIDLLVSAPLRRSEGFSVNIHIHNRPVFSKNNNKTVIFSNLMWHEFQKRQAQKFEGRLAKNTAKSRLHATVRHGVPSRT